MTALTVTVPEAAALLGLPKSTLYQALREGRYDPRLRPVRAGRTTRIPVSGLCDILGIDALPKRVSA